MNCWLFNLWDPWSTGNGEISPVQFYLPTNYSGKCWLSIPRRFLKGNCLITYLFLNKKLFHVQTWDFPHSDCDFLCVCNHPGPCNELYSKETCHVTANWQAVSLQGFSSDQRSQYQFFNIQRNRIMLKFFWEIRKDELQCQCKTMQSLICSRMHLVSGALVSFESTNQITPFTM